MYEFFNFGAIIFINNKHVSMAQGKLGDALKKADVDQGLSGAEPGSQAVYLAMCHLYFDSVEDFQNSFGPNTEEFLADIPNFTNTQPIIQISEVKI
ncbi:EthD family reductase [Desulfosarcina ovata]|uniref:Ethyl tert-butyl ether degradation protein EthD n=1 Tax=Desulfosarcina ovata subsp. ovata TaxID=2752305 RepID=A0A5K8AII9_9BACT|nr:EthD family reductase [Desulfosarcina ovata]BBO92503.1 ethyl tert-butyl ether degradation protein EthD [Desulfosarcina ovata subsp. ovata]